MYRSCKNSYRLFILTTLEIKLEQGWQEQLEATLQSEPLQELRVWLLERQREGAVIYPHASNWFRAFNCTSFEQVRVVILGQDPYHGPNQAHGLSFSVSREIAVPPSLKNIKREIQQDLQIETSPHGDLTAWAEQGVLLLNTSLTVERGKAGSHRGLGWELLTTRALEALNEVRSDLVFMLWGKHAQEAGSVVNPDRHLVLQAPHPSPYSASSGFFGCRHFSKANAWLQEHGQKAIDWS